MHAFATVYELCLTVLILKVHLQSALDLRWLLPGLARAVAKDRFK